MKDEEAPRYKASLVDRATAGDPVVPQRVHFVRQTRAELTRVSDLRDGVGGASRDG
jgi:hypothetical protein